jgi:acyl carrier protein
MKLTESQLRRIIREELNKDFYLDPITNVKFYDTIDDVNIDDVDIDTLNHMDLADYYEELQRKLRRIPQVARYQDQADELRARIARVRQRGESL